MTTTQDTHAAECAECAEIDVVDEVIEEGIQIVKWGPGRWMAYRPEGGLWLSTDGAWMRTEMIDVTDEGMEEAIWTERDALLATVRATLAMN